MVWLGPLGFDRNREHRGGYRDAATPTPNAESSNEHDVDRFEADLRLALWRTALLLRIVPFVVVAVLYLIALMLPDEFLPAFVIADSCLIVAAVWNYVEH